MAQDVDPRAETVLREMATLLEQAQTTRARISNSVEIEMQGMKQTFDSEYRLALARPSRFALVLETGMTGSTAISDGEELYVHVPMMNKYMVLDAPEDPARRGEAGLEALSAIESMGGFDLTRIFFADDPYRAIVEGASTVP